MHTQKCSATAARGMSQSLCIVLLLWTCSALSAQNEEHGVRNIVLVHGAWADGSGWKGVYDILVKDGYNVSIVQEPETSFKEDVAATKRMKRGRIRQLPGWSMLRPTCRMPGRMRLTTESDSQVISANRLR